MMRAKFVLFVLLLPLLCGAEAVKKKVAVLEIEDTSGKFDKSVLANATEMLRGRLSATGRFVVIDKSRQAEALKQIVKESKQESWKECYDSSCRIQLGQALSSDTILRPTISCIEDDCQLSCELVDLAKEATERGATADFNRQEKNGLVAALKNVVADLTETSPGPVVRPAPPVASEAPVTAPPRQIDSIVIIKTSPDAAIVTLDPGTSMERRCVSPCTLEEVPSGEHYIEFRKNLYRAKEYALTLTPGIRRVEETLDFDESQLALLALEMTSKGAYEALHALVLEHPDMVNAFPNGGGDSVFVTLLKNAPRETVLSFYQSAPIATAIAYTAAVYSAALEKGYPDIAKQCCGHFANAQELEKNTPAGNDEVKDFCEEQLGRKTREKHEYGVMLLSLQVSTPLIGAELEFYRERYKYFQIGIGSVRVGLAVDEELYYGFSLLSLGPMYTFGSEAQFEVGLLTSISPMLSGTNYYSDLEEPVPGYKVSITRAAWFYTRIYFRYNWDNFCLEAGIQFPLLWYQKATQNKATATTNWVKKDDGIAGNLLFPFDVGLGTNTEEKYSFYYGTLPPIFFYLGIGF